MVLIMIASVLLVIVIMAQNPKGGGLSSTFGGASSAQFGVQRTNDFMEKATWVLASIIIVLIFLSVILTAKPAADYNDAPIKKEKATSAPQAPAQKATNLPTTK